MTPEAIARVCHEANRAIQVEQADPTIGVGPAWDQLDDETKDSAVAGVLAALGGTTPEDSHAGWMRFKLDHGWTLGPVKDETTKQHPLLVPYADLPSGQKAKDRVFIAIVEALAH